MGRRILIAVLASLLAACSGDPEAAKQKLLTTGNKYFDNGKFREASIIYRRAIQKDGRFGEAYYRLGRCEYELGRYVQSVSALTRAVELLPENEDAYRRLADLYLAIYASNPEGNERVLADLQRITETAEQYFPGSLSINRVKGLVALTQIGGEDGPEAAERALELLERAHSQDPDDHRVALALVESMARAGRQDEALARARDLIDKDRNFALMYDFLYAHHVRNKRIEEALGVLQEKAGNNPDSVLFQLQLARHYQVAGQAEEMQRVLEEVIENPDRFPGAHRFVGDFYARSRDFDRALDTYQMGAEAEPGDRTHFRNKIVEVYAAQGRFDEAFRLVEETLADEPEDSVATALRGALRLRSRDRTEIEAAAADFESALARMPDNAVLRYNLAEAYRAQGDIERAIIEYQTAIDKRGDYLPPRYRLAMLQLRRGEFANAVAAAEEILRFAPRNIPARLIRANAWTRMGETGQARQSLEELVEANPAAKNGIYQLAALNLRERKYPEALELFQRLYESTPPDLRGLLGMVDVYVAQGRSEEAVSILRANLEADPDRVSLKLAMASTLNAIGRKDEAAQMLLDVLEQRPDDSYVHKLLGGIYYTQGVFASAEKHLTRASSLAPKDPAPILYLGMLAERQGGLQQAAVRYEQVIELAPDSATALNNLAYILAQSTADYDRALSLIQKARSLAPNDPNVADTMGFIYIKKNLPGSAVPILDQIVSQHPDVVVWRCHLAMALRLQGEIGKAKEHLAIALSNNPTEEEKLMISELMGQLGSG